MPVHHSGGLLMAVTLTERRMVEEAVDALARYNKSPFITDFLKQQSKPRISPGKYEKDELCALIKQVLLGEYRGKRNYSLKLDDLVNHLDRLQETGRQHVYLFRLPEEQAEKLLARLRDWGEVKALLGGQEELYSGGRLVWEARDGPQLALVRRDPPDAAARPRRLVLKWVETRDFWAPQKTATSSGSGERSEEDSEGQEAEKREEEETEPAEEEGEDQKVQIRVRREERTTTFFLIDLENGDCELRIQALHGLARATRHKQLATYRSLVAHLLGFEPVGPVVLAPAIRQALLARDVLIVRCSAILPDGGRFIGGKGELPPVDVRKLQAGVTIRFDWHQPSAGVGRVELDGRLDEILILRPLLPEQHHSLLERVRRWRQEGLATFTSAQEPKAIEGGVDLGPPHAASEVETPSLSTEAWIAILKGALGGAGADRKTVEPGIDRAIREYVRTHAVEEPVVTVSAESAAETRGPLPSVPAPGDGRPLEQFLGYIREVAQSERSSYQREIRLVRGEEQWTFRISIMAAVLALGIVAAGAVLLFAAKVAIGAVTSLLGALTGGGTWLIRSYASSLKAKRELIQEQQRDSQQTLIAIQTALSIPDFDQRSRAMSDVTATLLNRVASRPTTPEQIGVEGGDSSEH